MPVNAKGGKGYKKKKKGSSQHWEAVFLDMVDGQMPARVTRLLGNRNVLCYCNDNVMRICHICGAMKGRVFIEPGDIVIIGLRSFSAGAEDVDLKKVTRGDIVGKYPTEQYSQLKKQEGINPNLFQKLESGTLNTSYVGMDLSGSTLLQLQQDDGFDFEHSSDDDDEDDGKAPVAKTIVVESVKPRNDVDVNIDNL